MYDGRCWCVQANKPVYILAESFKFVRFYPLGQEDLPLEVGIPFSWASHSFLKLRQCDNVLRLLRRAKIQKC